MPYNISDNIDRHYDTVHRNINKFLKRGWIKIWQKNLGLTKKMTSYVLTDLGEKVYENHYTIDKKGL